MKRRWGVFCSAAERFGDTRPRYTAKTKAQAVVLTKKADRECASKARHEVRRLESRIGN